MAYNLRVIFLSLMLADSPRMACEPGELCDPMRFMQPAPPDTIFDLDGFVETELQRRRGYWVRALDNSRLYWPMVKQRVNLAGLPEQLAWLPLIESGFECSARSYRGAVGLWQFIPSTARAQGLKVSMWVDERLDPVKSTDAALRHLRDLYATFGDWNLALAAYNAGSGRVWWALFQASIGKKKRRRRGSYRRAKKWWMEKGEVWDYWEAYRYFPKETRRYVPLFYTGLAAVENYRDFGVDIYDTVAYPVVSDTVMVDYPTDLFLVAELMDLPPESVILRNPELILQMTPPDTVWPLRVPKGSGRDLAEKLQKVEPRPVTVWIYYRARRGDNLWKLAKRYGTTPEKLARINGLSLKKYLRLYQRLRIPKRITARSKRDEIYPTKRR